MRTPLAPRLVVLLLLTLPGPARATGAGEAARLFARIEEAYYRAHPTEATGVGLHAWDRELEDLAAPAVGRRLAELKGFARELAALRTGRLGPDDALDAEVVAGDLASEIQALEALRLWMKNPMDYVYLAGASVDGLMKRAFAPAAERLAAVVARLRLVPRLMAQMKANVRFPPREFVDLAVRMAADQPAFFTGVLADWAKGAAGADEALAGEFARAAKAAAAALEDAHRWLKDELAPRARGSFALGREQFLAKLRFDEQCELPLARLVGIGEARLAADRAAFAATARRIDPGASPAAVMARIAADHPTAARLVPDAQARVLAVKEFVEARGLATLPSPLLPRVQETPPYARDGGFASMDTPGPLETGATEAFYYITPPDGAADPAAREEHLRAFNRPVLDTTTIHETYPGHYLQFLWMPRVARRVRKLADCNSNIEGWAHYTEQLMLDEGFGGDDPALRLGQLIDALLRDCRFLVAIRLHTEGWTVEQAARVFVEQGYQEPANALEEARRGTYDPTYLYYTLGKLMILKLRDDVRAARGPGFSLRAFHDEFLGLGGIPLPLIRRLMLPGDAGPAL